MGAPKVLFIGGSGVISSASSRLAIERGLDLYVLNRGATRDRPLPPEAHVLHADVRDPGAVRAAVGHLDFDAVVDWVAFTPGHVVADLELFRDRTAQFV
ncbi:MAG TPA: NAD-dependent epimerase/dehydratase family protein, partial [Actinotalea sp.]|nr:NAD-dependent epimerase/dehydratase family protein [Actinotalea sp.]